MHIRRLFSIAALLTVFARTANPSKVTLHLSSGLKGKVVSGSLLSLVAGIALLSSCSSSDVARDERTRHNERHVVVRGTIDIGEVLAYVAVENGTPSRKDFTAEVTELVLDSTPGGEDAPARCLVYVEEGVSTDDKEPWGTYGGVHKHYGDQILPCGPEVETKFDFPEAGITLWGHITDHEAAYEAGDRDDPWVFTVTRAVGPPGTEYPPDWVDATPTP